MTKQTMFPLIKTHQLAETKAFYLQQLGWGLFVEMPGFFQVYYGDKNGPSLSFNMPEQKGLPPLCHPFSGQGIVFSIEVQNADKEYEHLQKAGVLIQSAPENKPWGWRSFQVTDPNGIILDFFHLVPPSPEFLAMLKS